MLFKILIKHCFSKHIIGKLKYLSDRLFKVSEFFMEEK